MAVAYFLLASLFVTVLSAAPQQPQSPPYPSNPQIQGQPQPAHYQFQQQQNQINQLQGQQYQLYQRIDQLSNRLTDADYRLTSMIDTWNEFVYKNERRNRIRNKDKDSAEREFIF